MRFVYAVMFKDDYKRRSTPANVFATPQAALQDFCGKHAFQDGVYVLVKIQLTILVAAKTANEVPILTFRLIGQPITIKQYVGAPFQTVAEKTEPAQENLDLFLSVLPRGMQIDKSAFIRDVTYLAKLNGYFYDDAEGFDKWSQADSVRGKYLFLMELLKKPEFLRVLRERPEISCHFLNTIVNPYEELCAKSEKTPQETEECVAQKESQSACHDVKLFARQATHESSSSSRDSAGSTAEMSPSSSLTKKANG